MPNVLERAAAVAGQLVMIAVGAYLGLQAEQWREDREQARRAERALRTFREEIAGNRARFAAVLPYHRWVADSLRAGFTRTLTDRRPLPIMRLVRETGYNGTQTVDPQTTAYDLAVATQALGELPPALSYQLARVYTRQRALAAYQDQFTQALMATAPAPRDDASRMLFMLDQAMHEIARQEGRLVAAYDSVLPRLDSALARK